MLRHTNFRYICCVWKVIFCARNKHLLCYSLFFINQRTPFASASEWCVWMRNMPPVWVDSNPYSTFKTLRRLAEFVWTKFHISLLHKLGVKLLSKIKEKDSFGSVMICFEISFSVCFWWQAWLPWAPFITITTIVVIIIIIVIITTTTTITTIIFIIFIIIPTWSPWQWWAPFQCQQCQPTRDIVSPCT